jgi:hypothetical protein
MALHHEDVWGIGCRDPRFLALDTIHQLHTLAALSLGKEPFAPNG